MARFTLCPLYPGERLFGTYWTGGCVCIRPHFISCLVSKHDPDCHVSRYDVLLIPS